MTVTLLCSCGPKNDRSTDGFVIVNESDSTLSVLVADATTQVEPGDRALIPMNDCLSGGIAVSDDAGLIYEYRGRICAAEVLRVADDRTAVIEALFG